MELQEITPRRVKVYLLDGENWIDNGTGYCTGEIDVKKNLPYFIVRNENDQSDIILKAFIEGSIQYQQQQETLIVWTDSKGKDIALSFQEPEGCSSLCDFLIEVQQNYQPNISLVAVINNGASQNGGAIDENGQPQGCGNSGVGSGNGQGGGDITELIVGPVDIPPLPTLKNLHEILEILNNAANSNYSKDMISQFLIESDYIIKLIECFNKCEKTKKLKNLHYLCEIIKILILYNNTQIIEILLDDSNIMGVVGILEYDPEFPTFKSNHRAYLKDESKFKEVLPVDNKDIINKIKQSFNLQFLKDVVLAKLLDDSIFSFIQASIYFNQVEVIKYLQEENNKFMESLFELYDDKNDNNENILEKRRDGVKMLHQFALIAKTLQNNQRSDFFIKLVRKGLFKMINFALKDDLINIRVLGTELIVSIIEHDVMLVNGVYSNAIANMNNNSKGRVDEDGSTVDNEIQNEDRLLSTDMTLILILTNLLIEEKDIGLKTQVYEALKVLLDPLSSNAVMSSDGHMALLGNFGHENGANDSSESTSNRILDFGNYFKSFYDKAACKLFSPLIGLSKLNIEIEKSPEQIKKEINEIVDIESINDCILLQHLCELIAFCSEKHEIFLSRSFFLENNILKGLKILTSPFFKKQARLSAIRCLKLIIKLDDDFYTRFIIANDILEYLGEFNLSKNNLSTSCILNILDYNDVNEDGDRRRNYKLIMNYINDKLNLGKLEEEIEQEDQIDQDQDQDDQIDQDDGDGETKKKDYTSSNNLKREISLKDYGSDSDEDNGIRLKKKRWNVGVKHVKKLFKKN
ncbi:hypothetical protein PACTADRAFT_50212 [Pachysolen tannophilus NRRL Y-2460]|uniref:Serine/threonine-protein phosphatase 4 regulatory subunit 3 n=1 Tax=Pachysolen tannophilus NRRL Y-2460 TaxID=669874 RepID=A0A1E4TUT7_PACTA|nr:hypothetical protein PACTADRAFT_50212 [Pachysolen tannophilus NRRL Y-2460]